MLTPSPVIPFGSPTQGPADFLAVHHIPFRHQTDEYCLFIEHVGFEPVRAYVFVPYRGFFLVEEYHVASAEAQQVLPALQERVERAWQQAGGSPSWRRIILSAPGTTPDDDDDLAVLLWLTRVAFDAAALPWAPQGTSICFLEVVRVAFIGHSDEYEGAYTADGLQLWPRKQSKKALRTLRQHLQWLHQERLLVVFPTLEEQSVTVQFKRPVIAPALDLPIAPYFFRSLFYE